MLVLHHLRFSDYVIGGDVNRQYVSQSVKVNLVIFIEVIIYINL